MILWHWLKRWERRYIDEQVVKKVGLCQEKLKWWSKKSFSNVTWEIPEKKRQMKKAELAALNGNNADLMVKLKEELANLLSEEEKMQHQ